MKTIIFSLLIFPLLLFSQKRDSVALHFSSYITAETMRTNLQVLASDAYEGRETGKKGQKMAADYLASQFKSFRIPPFKEETYYQQFPLQNVNSTYTQTTNFSISGKTYVERKDYYILPNPSDQKLDIQKIVFIGYGIEESTYNDYKDIDVNGKVLMVLQGEPLNKESISLITHNKSVSEWSTYNRKKVETARKKGAEALLIVDENILKKSLSNGYSSVPFKLEKGQKEMPVVYISKEVAELLLKNKSIDLIKNKIQRNGKPHNKKVDANAEIDIKLNEQIASSENVIAFIEGTDLKDELIVISAHYDHLGKIGELIFNGADDDGSGTVALLNIAEAFARAKKEGNGPRRSVVCIAFSGEEKGLLGSIYYTQHPEFPLKNTVCDLNIDMIGRIDEKHINNPDYIYLIGADKLSSELHQISETINKTYSELELDYTYNDEKEKNRFYYRSDHYNFAKNGIPVIFYFNGVHADYHKETDEVEKINFEKMEKITRYVFLTAWELVNRNERIVVDSNKK